MAEEQDYNPKDRLDERRRLLESIVANANDAILVTEAESIDEPGPRIVFANESFTRMTGYSFQEVVGKTPRILQGPETDRAQLDRIRSALSKDEPVRVELLNYRKDVTQFWVEISIVPVRDEGGKATQYVSVQREITERKRMEQELRKSEERLRAVLVRYGSDIITILEADGTIRYESPALERAMGYRPEERVGKSVFEYLHPDDLEEARRRFAAFLEDQELNVPTAYRFRHADGSWRYLEATACNLLDDPDVQGIVVNTQDVSERRRMEQEIRESEERFRTVVEQAADALFIHDLNGRFVDVNRQACESLGYTRDELLTLSVADIEHNIEPGGFAELWQRIVSEGPVTIDGLHRRKDGTDFPVEVRVGLLEMNGTQLMLAAARDITERKRAEEAQYASEMRFRQLFEQSVDTQLVHDEEGRILDCNPEASRALGYTREELLSLNVRDIANGLISEEEKKERKKRGGTLWQRVVRGESVAPAVVHFGEHKRKNGTTFPIEVHVGGVDYGGRRAILASARDITERKEVERRLEESEQRYRSLFDQNPDAVYSLDLEGNYLAANAACEKVSGYTVEELLQMSFVPLVVPEDLERTWQGFERAASGEPQNYEIAITHKDGLRVELNVTNVPIVVDDEIVGVYGIAKDITDRKRGEEARSRLAAIVESSDDAILSNTLEGIINSWNPGAEKLYGYSANEVLGEHISILFPPERQSEVSKVFDRIGRKGEINSYETVRMAKDGRRIPVSVTASPVRGSSGSVIGTSGILRDITERKRAEEELRRSEARNRAILEANPDLIFIFNRDGEYLDVQASDSGKLYLPREEFLGSKLQDVLPPEVADPSLRKIVRTLDTGEMQIYEYQLDVPEGALDFEARLVVSGPDEVLWAVRDVTERKALEQRLEYQAFHDPLTGLPNRSLFMDRIQHALARIGRHGGPLAVLFLDLDNFKTINDSLGHTVGDQLLAKVAHRLKTCLRPEDTVARFGGDEFIVLVEGPERVDGATLVAERIAEALRAPFVLDGHEVSTTTSIGIALGTSSRDVPDDLLRNADFAMYRAKEQGKSNYEVFDPSMSSRALERLKLENDLKRAIERGEFMVHYQPKIELSTGKIVGVEALARWNHPERGLVLPKEFIPLAEETGLIIPIGNWVLERACRQARVWQEQHTSASSLTMCVNLSARQVRYPRLAQEVIRIIRETGVNPNNLNLEITESVAMGKEEGTFDRLLELKQLGIELAIDDFGTGYSSLSYLKHLPVDDLKIDKSFVWGLEEGSDDTMLVSAIIELACALGLRTVAEGVETAEQLKQLRKLGCHMAQGNYFMKPLGSEEVSALVEAGLPVT